LCPSTRFVAQALREHTDLADCCVRFVATTDKATLDSYDEFFVLGCTCLRYAILEKQVLDSTSTEVRRSVDKRLECFGIFDVFDRNRVRTRCSVTSNVS
jgi:hypothetical protein